MRKIGFCVHFSFGEWLEKSVHVNRDDSIFTECNFERKNVKYELSVCSCSARRHALTLQHKIYTNFVRSLYSLLVFWVLRRSLYSVREENSPRSRRRACTYSVFVFAGVEPSHGVICSSDDDDWERWVADGGDAKCAADDWQRGKGS